MSFTTILLGLTLIAPAMAAPADSVKAPKPKPEARAPAPLPRPAPKVEPRRNPPAKPLVPVGEPKLKRRKLPD
jgi:hypothetical protein